MRDMDALRSQLARHRLRQRAHAELGHGEGRELRPASTEGVEPVKSMVPRPSFSIARAAARATKKPPRHATRQA